MKNLIIINFEQEFNAIYRRARKKSAKFADAAIKQELKLVGPLNKFANLLYVNFRVFSVRFAIILFAVILLALPLLALIRSNIRIEYVSYFDLAVSLVFLIIMCAYGMGLWCADRTLAVINDTARRQITAGLIVEMWTRVMYKRGKDGHVKMKKLCSRAKGVTAYDVSDLLLAFKASLNRLKLLRDMYIGFGFGFAVFLNIYKGFVGDDKTLREQTNNILYVGNAAPLLFLFVTVIIIIFISGPLSWREQLEPFLIRAVEKRKEVEIEWADSLESKNTKSQSFNSEI